MHNFIHYTTWHDTEFSCWIVPSVLTIMSGSPEGFYNVRAMLWYNVQLTEFIHICTYFGNRSNSHACDSPLNDWPKGFMHDLPSIIHMVLDYWLHFLILHRDGRDKASTPCDLIDLHELHDLPLELDEDARRRRIRLGKRPVHAASSVSADSDS